MHSDGANEIPATPRRERACVAQHVKDIVDLGAAIVAVFLFSPCFLILAAIVSLGSPGPIIFRRRVLGRDGAQFDAFKFRTMIQNADQVLCCDDELMEEYEKNMKLKRDPRITSSGRWLRRLSLDELPQLFNVLRGEMSLVGPRMIAPDELARYGEFAEKRLTVKPGMTGLWQVSGRQDVSYDTRILLDMQYIDNWSLLLDLMILLKTPLVVVRGRGAL